MAKSLVTSDASTTPIVDLVALDLAKADLEREKAVVTDKLKEAALLRDRHAKVIEDQTSRLKHHGAGMLAEDKAEIQRAVLAATAGLNEAKREVARLTKDDRALAGGLSEVKHSIDAVYAALRREMLSAGSGVDPSGSALRDGIFSIVHELAELSTDATSFFVYNPRAEGVPHFTTWETKSSSLVRSITDKFTAAHRCILNALNKIASGSPDLAAHDYLWATLVNDAANAFLATVARVLDTSMGDLRRVLDGGCAQPLFSINVKLTANSKLILAPAMTESYKLVQPLLTAAFDMAQLPHFRTATTVQAKAPSAVDSASRPATAGRRVAAAKHTGPLSAAVASDCGMEQSLKYLPCLAGHVKGIQNACAVLDQRVADIVNTLDANYGHLWSSQLPDMTLSQLEVSRRAIEVDAGFEKGTTVGDAIHVNTFPLHDAVLSMMAQQESKLRANSLARALEDVASAIEDSSIKTIRRNLPASLLPAGASAQGSGVPKKPQVLGAAPPKVPDLTIDPTKLDPDAAHERAKQAGADANFKRQEEKAAAAAKDTTPRQSQQHLSSMSQSTDVDVAPQVSPRPSTTPVGYRGSANAAAGQRGRSGSERSLRGGAARDDSVGAMSASKRHDGPATPNPKGERSSQRSTAAPAASNNGSTTTSGRLDFSSGPNSGHAAWGTPPRQAREQPPEDDGLRSPASQARTNATLHMSTPPQSPSAAPGTGFNSSASSPSAGAAGGRAGGTGGSHMDRLAAKERESMDRLKNLREQAEARRRALDDAPDAPTPQQMQQEQKQKQQQHGRPSAAASSSGSQPTSGRRASKTPSDAASSSVAPSPAHHHQQQDMTTDPDARRRERAAALQRERLQREREMLLESHRAQERRRDAEKAQAEADMAAKIKAEQQRRQKELEAERQADERRREAADRDRTRRDAQRKVDEQRESELRQRLDELERRRRSDARRFTDERTSSAQASPEKSTAAAASTTRPSIYASPNQRQQQLATATATSNSGNAPPSPYSVRPSSRGAKPAPADNAIDPLSGTDTAGHAAPDSARGGSSSHGATTTTATSSALRKKLGLPPTSGTSTPTTASAPTSGRQFGQASGGVAYASQQRTTPPPSSAPAGAPHPAPTPTTASSPGPQKPPSTAEASTTRAGAHSLSGTRPSSSPGQTAGVAVDGIASIDTAGKSHLEVYRSYCTALNIKPNSGLLKSLPDVPGRHSTSINLDLNYIGVRGVRPLIEILKLNRGLTLLNLKDNNLENAEVRQIVSVLMGDAGRSIEHLDLSNNPISLAGGSAIMDLVSRQPTLRTVVLKGTLIQAKVVEKITEAASRNPGA